MKLAAKWNRFMKEYEGVTANENIKQSKPTLVLSVIGDSSTFVPKQWPKNVFQTALIEAAKSNEGMVFCLKLYIVYNNFQIDKSRNKDTYYDSDACK